MALVYRLRHLHDNSPAWLRRTGATVLGRLPVRWRYGRTFRTTWDLLHQAERWTPAERAAYQVTRLRHVLGLAGRSVPYYRRLFGERGFDPAHLRDRSDLQVLPLLTRDDVRRLDTDLLPDGHPPAESKYSTTGGTTGKPLGFWITHDASAAEWAFMLHGWRRAGFKPGDWRVVVRGRVVSGRGAGRAVEVDALNQAIYVSGFDLSAETLGRCIGVIRRSRARFLHAFPSSATVVAQHLERTGDTLPSIRALLLGSENIYPGQRAYLERVFGCRVFTWYGHSEKSIFAPECRCGRTYQVSDPYGVAELVDADGQPITRPGERGLLVGTGFINHATLFVRYLTDDQAEWVEGPCPGCGAEGLLLTRIVGRWNQEYLVGRSGALIPMAAINLHTRVYTSLRQFQFRQETPGEAVLLAVRSDAFRADDEAELRRELGARLGGEVAISIEFVPELPLSAAGKFKFVDQRLDLNLPAYGQSVPGNPVRSDRSGGDAGATRTSTSGE